jgi:hypothetical protein
MCRFLFGPACVNPWLNESWRSDDVYFFGDNNYLLKQSQHPLPYMSASVRAPDPSSPTTSKVPSADYGQIIRNPVLFGLGVMFLELAFQAPLRSLQHPIDLKRGETQGFAEYCTARRLAEHSSAMISQSYQSIVKKCLYCDFGHDSDFKSPALQEAFYHEVIGGLGRLEEVFRDLQLDDRKLSADWIDSPLRSYGMSNAIT